MTPHSPACRAGDGAANSPGLRVGGLSILPPMPGNRDRDGFAASKKGRHQVAGFVAASHSPGALTECATSDDRAGADHNEISAAGGLLPRGNLSRGGSAVDPRHPKTGENQ